MTVERKRYLGPQPSTGVTEGITSRRNLCLALSDSTVLEVDVLLPAVDMCSFPMVMFRAT